MATRRKANTETTKAITSTPRSLEIAARGVETGEDFARLMSALMGDVIAGALSPNVANAACRAGVNLLKVIEMQYKYGSQASETSKPFRLVAQAK